MITFREAHPGETKLLARLSADAFFDYPLYQIMRDRFKTQAAYDAFLYAVQLVFMTGFVEHAPLFVCEYGGKAAGVVMLAPPQAQKLHIGSYIKSGGLRLLQHTHLITMLRYLLLLGQTGAPCAALKRPQWYLSTLAVDKAYQGKQIGTKAILEFIVPYVRARGGKLLTLTTNTESNSNYYARKGFTLFDKRTLKLGKKSIEHWSFLMEL